MSPVVDLRPHEAVCENCRTAKSQVCVRRPNRRDEWLCWECWEARRKQAPDMREKDEAERAKRG